MTTTAFKSLPVDKQALLADKARMREAIYTFGCLMPGLRFTLTEVCEAFSYPRHRAWTRIQELKRGGRVTVLEETRNRQAVYKIAVKEN